MGHVESVVRNRLKIYRELAKSGIVTLVLISVLGGYLIGHSPETPLSLTRLGLTLLGILLLASGSSALNQLQEIQQDAKMPRTAQRPLPSGRLSRREAILFVASTLLGGIGILAWLSPKLLVMGLAAVVFYNGLYTLWWKRKLAFAAVPGAIPGALPIWMGYVAATDDWLAPGGLYLFAVLFYWQMPHFWSLAIRFQDDYAKGAFPVLPVAHGTQKTLFQIALWSVSYVALGLMGPLFLRVGVIYMIVAGLTGIWVLWELARFLRGESRQTWLRFFLAVNFSLITYVFGAAADLWSIHLIGHLSR